MFDSPLLMMLTARCSFHFLAFTKTALVPVLAYYAGSVVIASALEHWSMLQPMCGVNNQISYGHAQSHRRHDNHSTQKQPNLKRLTDVSIQ